MLIVLHPDVTPQAQAAIEGRVRELGFTPHAICGAGLVVMAGPCAVENEQQILTAARGVAASGASLLRGGAFKPRTSPYDFQGLKQKGLELLARARAETG